MKMKRVWSRNLSKVTKDVVVTVKYKGEDGLTMTTLYYENEGRVSLGKLKQLITEDLGTDNWVILFIKEM